MSFPLYCTSRNCPDCSTRVADTFHPPTTRFTKRFRWDAKGLPFPKGRSYSTLFTHRLRGMNDTFLISRAVVGIFGSAPLPVIIVIALVLGERVLRLKADAGSELSLDAEIHGGQLLDPAAFGQVRFEEVGIRKVGGFIRIIGAGRWGVQVMRPGELVGTKSSIGGAYDNFSGHLALHGNVPLLDIRSAKILDKGIDRLPGNVRAAAERHRELERRHAVCDLVQELLTRSERAALKNPVADVCTNQGRIVNAITAADEHVIALERQVSKGHPGDRTFSNWIRSSWLGNPACLAVWIGIVE